MGTITNQHQIALGGGRDLNAADDFAEEGIADVRHDHQDGAGFVAFNVAPHGLREITDLKRRLFNPVSGRLGDFVRVHQCAGHGCC